MIFKSNKGITLVALVITIVIMLILAGIVLNLTLGENGIITRAKESQLKSSQAELAEAVDLAYAELYTDKLGNQSEMTAEELQNILENKGYTLDEDVTLSEGVFTVKINGATITKNITTGEITVDGQPIQTTPSGNGGSSSSGSGSSQSGQETGGGSNNESGQGTSGSQTGPTVDLKVGTTSLAGTSTSEALKNYYGETVTGFKPVTEPTDTTAADYSKNLELYNINWQLFYDDATNVYLIASDYVRVNALPNELTKNPYDSDTNKKYDAWFTTGGSTPNYTGPIMENTNGATNPWPNGSDSTVLKGANKNPLVSTYLKWIGSSFDTNATAPNLKAVAYMMDTNVWSDFKGNVTGAYAIGGPTLEMFEKSYNAAHEIKLAEHNSITAENATNYGYKVAWAETQANTEQSWDNYFSGFSTTTDSMWVITSTDKAYLYWFASPVSDMNYNLHFMAFNGASGYCSIAADSCGFRPVVVIPKTSIQTANN